MARAKTTDDLLTDVRARTAAPAANDLVSSTELLALIDEEMRSELASLIVSMRSEYWLTEDTQSITSGTSSYRIPDRAIGMTVSDVTVYDSSDNEWNLIQLPTEERHRYTGSTSSCPEAFCVQNGTLVLLPEPNASGYTLRIRYYERPSKLVATSLADLIERPVTTTTIEVANGTLASLTTSGNLLDIVRGDGMHEPVYQDLISAGYSGGTLNLNASTPIVVANVATSNTGGERADYVCVAGETVYPPIPDTLYPVLVELGALAYCEAIGDMRGMDAAASRLERKKRAALSMMVPRVDGEVMRPVARHTPLRGSSGTRWRHYG